MATLYVKNPNYNPLDPKSLRYVSDGEAQNQAGVKAMSLNEAFAPFTSALGDIFKPFTASSFYTPLPQNATVTPTNKLGTPTVNYTSGQNTPVNNARGVEATKALGATNAVPATGQPATTPASSANHVIQAGDTLSAIAARYGTTVQALAQANGISNPDRIQVGQVLNLTGNGTPKGAGNAPATNGAGGAAPIQTPTGALTPQEIAKLAKQAGEAGMSASEFMSILNANSGANTAQVEDIRTKLGIPNLVDEAFKTPTKSTIDQYKELYDIAGLRDIQTKISEVDASINSKRADLVKATGEINNNPWISQATRAGRLKNLQELAYADINNDIERKNQYLDIYDKGVNEVEKQLGFITADRQEERGLTVDKLNYLLNEAERIQKGIEQDSVTGGLRNIPDFLQGTLNRESTAQARELEQIRANKASSGGGASGANILDLILGGGGSNDVISASAGGKATTDTFRTSYEKTLNTLYQLSDLGKAFDTYKEKEGKTGVFGTSSADKDLTAPIMGIIRSANPYDTKAQQIKAQLTALVPNLARGVYGEVGVLTDQDIANYTKTLPNLKSTKEVRDALLAISAKSVYRALENKLLVQAKGGVDVSGYATDLTQMRTLTDNLLQSAGVPTESIGGGGANYSSADQSYVKSLGL